VFLTLDCREAFYGGAAGGGKSDALLMAALQYADVPDYAALILRRTYGDLAQPNALMDRAAKWLSQTSAKKQDGGKRWLFPSGARLVFGHVQNYAEAETQFSSAEFQFIGIDELTQGWEERTYKFLFSRIRRPRMNCRVCRRPIQFEPEEGVWVHVRQAWCEKPVPVNMPSSPDGVNLANVPLRMRSASNPGGSGHLWVKERFVDAETREPRAVFVPATLDDNPHLDAEEYTAMLEMQGGVLTERLLRGDWEVVEQGRMFQRHWFKFTTAFPTGVEWVRYWDMASGTKKHLDDATAGALLGVHRSTGTWYLRDMQWLHLRPLGLKEAIVATAHEDNADAHVPIYVEQESGSSGVYTMDDLRVALTGFEFHPDSPRQNKTERARPTSSTAEAGKFLIVCDPGESGRPVPPRWLKEFLNEVELFPNGPHDDQVDAVSGAMKVLTKKAKRQARATTLARRQIR
jgi:predicted phage terminase large subunit-like protein